MVCLTTKNDKSEIQIDCDWLKSHVYNPYTSILTSFTDNPCG